MGFSTILDILGSIVVGGLLLLMLFRTNDSVAENNYQFRGELIAQQNLKTVVSILEHDFRKIAYCKDPVKLPDPSKAILFADSSQIRFLTDENNDGNVDTMDYYIGSTSELPSTPNPNDRFFYRVVNNEIPKGVNLGITRFKLIYFNASGDTIKNLPVPIPGAITTMQIDIVVEDVWGYNKKYSSAFWQQLRLAARNLNNR